MFRIVLGIGVGVACGLLLCEGALWLLPTQNGIFAADRDEAWPVHHLVQNSTFTHSSGWNFRDVVRGKINNFGYVAPFDYQRGADAIVVLGDSYIESMMNPYEQTLQANIQRAVRPDLAVLSFGSSGSSLADYLGMATLVRVAFKPEWVVVLITEGDYREGFARSPGYFHWSDRPPELTALTPDRERRAVDKIVRRLGLVRYVRGNLRMSWNALFGAPTVAKAEAPTVAKAEAPTCVPESLTPDDETRIRAYAAALPGAYGVPPQHVIIVFDAETLRTSLYAGNAARDCPRRDDLARARLMAQARASGMRVVDTNPLFERHYRTTGLRVDHSPLDDHWNEIGHRLAADAVLAVMQCAPSEPATPPTTTVGDATFGATSSPLTDRYRAQMPSGGQC